MERIILITKAKGLFIIGQDKILFFSVTTKRIPKGIPMTAAMMAETESIYNVSAKLFSNKSIIIGDITNHLAFYR